MEESRPRPERPVLTVGSLMTEVDAARERLLAELRPAGARATSEREPTPPDARSPEFGAAIFAARRELVTVEQVQGEAVAQLRAAAEAEVLRLLAAARAESAALRAAARAVAVSPASASTQAGEPRADRR